MDKRFWAILGVIAVIVVGAIWITNNKKAAAPSSNASATNHVEGKNATGIKLVEYGDYECPYCGAYYPIVKQVVAEYANQITFQFRNLPLTQLHPNAFAGARAAEAASLQGKFWQMHDMLYENQDSWVNSSSPSSIFNSYAQQLGLNVTKFKSDYASDEVNNLINADVDAFNKTGAQEATPTFFLDGKQVQPTETVASFEQIINNAIKQKGFTPQPIKTSPSGTTSPNSSSSNTAPQSKQ
jgi:protein-disulfide isomerase